MFDCLFFFFFFLALLNLATLKFSCWVYQQHNLCWIAFNLSLCSQLKKFEESEHMQKDALNAYMKLFGEESVEVALVLNQLGATYLMTEQFHKSRFANAIVALVFATFIKDCCISVWV